VHELILSYNSFVCLINGLGIAIRCRGGLSLITIWHTGNMAQQQRISLIDFQEYFVLRTKTMSEICWGLVLRQLFWKILSIIGVMSIHNILEPVLEAALWLQRKSL
jgi:hypothetical protein